MRCANTLPCKRAKLTAHLLLVLLLLLLLLLLLQA
jgi:hypothetical protein